MTVLVENMTLLHRLRARDAALANRIERAYLSGTVGPHVTNKRLLDALARTAPLTPKEQSE